MCHIVLLRSVLVAPAGRYIVCVCDTFLLLETSRPCLLTIFVRQFIVPVQRTPKFGVRLLDSEKLQVLGASVTQQIADRRKFVSCLNQPI